jgi:hypothetical protein
VLSGKPLDLETAVLSLFFHHAHPHPFFWLSDSANHTQSFRTSICYLSSPMDTQYCSGDANGVQCRCRRFIPKGDSNAHCTCEHPEGYHPDTPRPSVIKETPASIVASYQAPSSLLTSTLASSSMAIVVPVASSSKSTTSTAQALAETTAGFRKRKRRDSNAPEPNEPLKKVTIRKVFQHRANFNRKNNPVGLLRSYLGLWRWAK